MKLYSKQDNIGILALFFDTSIEERDPIVIKYFRDVLLKAKNTL